MDMFRLIEQILQISVAVRAARADVEEGDRYQLPPQNPITLAEMLYQRVIGSKTNVWTRFMV
jgi:hypothetical protein